MECFSIGSLTLIYRCRNEASIGKPFKCAVVLDYFFR